MKLILLLFVSISLLSKKAESLDISGLRKEFEETINGIEDFLDFTKDAMFNCSITPQDLKIEMGLFFADLMAVSSQELLKDVISSTKFPTACHVLYDDVLNDITIEKKMDESGNTKVLGVEVTKNEKFKLEISYYWPKYFIEASEKSNDPFEAFSHKNSMYLANRKLVEQLASQYDTGGFEKVLEKLKKNPIGSLAALVPLGSSGIRASQDPDHPNFEVNIWPVGLSHALGKVSLCGSVPTEKLKSRESIGYNFDSLSKLSGVTSAALAGVPQLCPISSSQDLAPYWYTGVLDHMDLTKKAASSAVVDPTKCLTASAADMLADLIPGKSAFFDQNAGNDFKTYLAKVKDLANIKLSGLLGCSFPLTGSIEALASNYLAFTHRFQGPYCSLWGPVYPRMSAHYFNNDYSFALAALKYKLLAEDIHGLPRVNKERWSLAYPWDDGESVVDNGLKKLAEVSGKMGEHLGKIGNMSSSRSKTLYMPGDIRLIDLVLNPTHLAKRSTQLGKELAYLGALFKAGSEARKAVEKQEELKRKSMDSVNQAEENTRLLGDSDIVTCENLCHRSQRFGQRILFGSNKIDVGKWVTEHYPENKPEHGSYSFSPIGTSTSTKKEARDECLKESGYEGKHKGEINRSTAIFYYQCKITGTKKSIKPIKATISTVNLFNEVKPEKTVECIDFIFDKHCTEETLNELSQVHLEDVVKETIIDTKEIVKRPEKEEFSDSNQLKGALANSAAWVGAELVRQKYEKITGTNNFPGNKRVYTIWQKVECSPDYKIQRYTEQLTGKIAVETYFTEDGSSPCRAFLRRKLRELFHKRFMRKYCNLLSTLGSKQSLGEPFK